jgi:hypothetical protein
MRLSSSTEPDAKLMRENQRKLTKLPTLASRDRDGSWPVHAFHVAQNRLLATLAGRHRLEALRQQQPRKPGDEGNEGSV